MKCDVTNWIYMVCELRYSGGFSGYQVASVRCILNFERCHNVCLNGFSPVPSSPGFCGYDGDWCASLVTARVSRVTT